MKNKIFSGTLALILTIFCLAVPLSAYASETLGTNSQNLETNTEVKIIQENLTLYKNENGISLVTITDENKLLVELKNANSSLSVLDVKTTIDAFNNQLQKISFVFQNARLFKMSLRKNLLIGKEDATDKEIEQALSDAGAKEFVENLKDGLKTVYGSTGTYFSGGEAQRLVIARAFLKDADYVILDEATAFADPENEHIIQESFKKLAKNKTTLMIAHRLSTVIDADKILVIEGGQIAEEGKHEELLGKQGVYKSLWEEYQRSVKWKIGGKND
ncbi:TPA: ATP-binding cassette domain-containing protein [Enterococcus faecalis]